MTKLIHEELTYAIRGVFFSIHNELGPNLPEKFYQDAVVIGLKAKGVACQTEKECEVTYRGVQVGRYFVDVWVEQGKVLLELKVSPEIEPIHEAQAISYLKVTDADLAIVANFGQGSFVDRRLPNFLRNKIVSFDWKPQPIPSSMLFPELTNELLTVLHRIHFELGPGFLHQVYRRATMVELSEQGIGYEYIKEMPVYYRGHHLGNQETRLICVDGVLLLATVAVREVDDAMKAQLKAKLRHLELNLGILANFNREKLEVVMIRRDNNG
jgi:GxxExxY protein